MQINRADEQACVKEVMAWEHQCWEWVRDGKDIPLDPFYPRNDLLTEEVVLAVIKQHEENLQWEIDRYPIYHYEHQGRGPTKDLTHDQMREKLAPTGWDTLPYQQQFAIVQGIDQICQKYRDDSGEKVASEPQPGPDEAWVWC